MYWFALALRWFHLVAAMVAVGGTAFMRFALVPSVSVLADEQRKALHEQIRSRWAKLVAGSVAFLLISGLINFVLFLTESKTEPWAQWHQAYNSLYQFVFGAKFALAMVVFFIASALAGRGQATQKFRQDATWWMTVNLVLALVVVALSGVLRFTHVGPTLPKIAATATAPVEIALPSSSPPSATPSTGAPGG
ncbi:MAG TPA: hypothetical protein VFE46_14720 [Pirellulales bacterium]|jgi:uncharacterized membrane protein|nr:hypothetical protein [Pirellulales bacterium]